MINCGIVGNAINNGSAGMYFTAGGSNNLIEENTVTNPYYYGMLLQGLNGLKLRNNNINIASASSYYALYLYNINNAGTTNVEITGNAINTAGYGYPLFWQNTSATASARAQFANNKLNVNSSNYIYGGAYLYNLYYCDIYNNDFNVSTTNGYAYGIYGFYAYNCKIYNNVVNTNASLGTSYSYMMYYGSYDTVYNNTFIMRGTNSSYAGYVYTMYSSYPGHMYRNNVYANLAGGTALYLYDAMNNGITSHDYNNIWTSGSSFVTGYATYNTLQAYRTGSGFDRNSLSYDPGFMSNTDPHPDPNNPASWSLNGRGIHLPWNTLDKEGNPRVTTLAAGVPDIGAYEFVPNTTPPLAVATPATPAVGKQVFTFGQDTVAAITWKPNTQIPNTINVRQYTGTQPPNFPNTGKMYFYVDVNGANSTYDYTGDVYYKDPWRGTTSATETNLRMVKKLTPGSWQAYNGTLSSVNASLNILKANMTDLGMMSGIDDGILFSAIVTPGGNLIFCPGGSVTLHANSGAGYTYQWTYNTVNIPGATAPSYVATAAGDYAVKITDPNNITATSNPILVTIIAPPAAQVSASGPLTYCTGGNLTLNAATAPGQFYQWYLNGNQIPGATQSNYNVTTHGNYTVMVKNSGCSSTSPIQVVSEGPLHVNLGTDTSFCEGTPLTLDAGYPGASYQWSDGTNGQSIQISNKNQSGTYWVSVNAGPNCQDVDTIHVTVNPLPSVIGISYVKNNNTYYFEPSGPADVNSYLWMFDDGTTDTAKKPVKVYNTPEFEVKLVVFNACGTDTVILKLPLAVSNLAAGDVNVKVYPNPASSRITLSTEGTRFSDLSVINDLGQTVYRSSLEGDRTSEDVDVSSLANGHYFIRATTTDGSTINKPFNIVR